MHPSVPLGRNLRGVVLMPNVIGKLHPTIASIKVVRILKVLVTILVLSDQFARFDVVVTEIGW